MHGYTEFMVVYLQLCHDLHWPRFDQPSPYLELFLLLGGILVFASSNMSTLIKDEGFDPWSKALLPLFIIGKSTSFLSNILQMIGGLSDGAFSHAIWLISLSWARRMNGIGFFATSKFLNWRFCCLIWPSSIWRSTKLDQVVGRILNHFFLPFLWFFIMWMLLFCNYGSF